MRSTIPTAIRIPTLILLTAAGDLLLYYEDAGVLVIDRVTIESLTGDRMECRVVRVE